ncbi:MULTISPECIES: class I SAM-dependent methyltransferase [Methylobacterium]|uniref:class I SAM-dependent methyltransferase n=1 Tax=Methylobacterium TaxID=407 RepID=UPI0008F0B119|nr:MULTISPECIES: class I SAM-dependent methyltransferase [Methylobacterium]MBZ6412432.1 class I SAM-dependent methyltransferase [Methylobacterium sp.]MBK3396466.1 class I SAM-dependent methyltransferase [Methylobacterium ajmalii]MBK3407806.1 class I SAM-dependent methyltransferase [Methylobacterium ajmalii]MBK3422793.1 class I SAM-dependent methyltransferase [Methylobacterium ajmalii]SFE28055.1 Methyltransferase domain-containing protein [Methylobacterium sp. yr596]
MTDGSAPRGTAGYAAEAERLVSQYESIAFADIHAAILPLLPAPPAHVLDIGAGTGRDAAGFAALGYRVTAVEPTLELRRQAVALHPSPLIDWVDDGLPDLAALSGRGDSVDVVMLTAVWMHLDEAERRRAMPRLVALMRVGGVMALSLRHGPVPEGRRMFDVSAAETIDLARVHGLRCVLCRTDEDAQLGRPGVTWDRVAFVREAGPGASRA